MDRPLPYAIVAMLVLLTGLVLTSTLGCTSNPRVDFANAQDTYNVVVSKLIENRDSFSDEDWNEDVLPAIQAGDAALDQYDLLTAAGLDADSARATLRQVLVLLVGFVERTE